MKILILSTHPPRYSAGLGADVQSALERGGHKVDFVSRIEDPLFPETSHPIVPPSRIKRLMRRFITPRRLEKILSFIRSLRRKKNSPPDYVIFNNGFEIHYPDELSPDLPVQKVLDSVEGPYDLVITLWWFATMTSVTLEALHRKLKCPILIYAIDMAPITGGCFYFKDCRNFYHGCGNCPALNSPSVEDQTHRNFMIKKENYSRMPVGFLGNSWMNDFAIKSGLFSESSVFNVSIIVDGDDFCLRDSQEARKEMGLEDRYEVLFMARSSAELRKGAPHIIEGIRQLWKSLSTEQRQKMALLTVGDSTIHRALMAEGINSVWLGKVERPKLISAYQASSFFLSASVDDAGPSMVNQAMMCGTPVIAFNNGTAVDVVENGKTGFKSDTISSAQYANLIRTAYELACQSDEYQKMRKATRSAAIRYNSPEAFEVNVIKAYKSLKEYER